MTKPILSSTSDPFLTTKEAAQCLGVTLRTVQLWVEAGKLQAARTPGGHRRIRASDVRALQEQMGIKPAKAVVVLTDEQLAAALCEIAPGEESLAGWSFADWMECCPGAATALDEARLVQAAVLAANDLGADHA